MRWHVVVRADRSETVHGYVFDGPTISDVMREISEISEALDLELANNVRVDITRIAS
jgi:hypothetical protein